ncbi:penicillin-binding protein activator [uncultured Turicimonas sp.]|uniref:penicillin-binding protein activator n=1 Tax=uncultured Turicimonas sp. TaxID=1918607 RepID=UPI003211A2CB
MSSTLLNKVCFVTLSLLSLMGQNLVNAQEAAVSPSEPTGKIKVGLMVPPQNSSLAAATAPLINGVEAAFKEDEDRYELVKYEISESGNVLNVLNHAADTKAMLMIGPVLKTSVDKIASLPYLPLPVVAINKTDSAVQPELFMSIDVAIESEVEQLVKVALDNTAKNPVGAFVVLATPNSYDERVARAIVQELSKNGSVGEIRHVSTEQISYLRTEMRGKSFRGAFFAMNPQQASLIRPYLPPELPVFGTSYTNPYRTNDVMTSQTQANDLTGMVTLEIPAITQLSHQNYLKYRPILLKLNSDDRHLFAVGVDAWALGKSWLEWHDQIDLEDGLSGKIHFNKKTSSSAKRTLDKTVVTPKRDLADDVAFEESAEEAGL